MGAFEHDLPDAGPKFSCEQVDNTGCIDGVLCCAKVRTSREHYDLCLLDASPLASHLLDPEKGILTCNKEALRLFGVASKQAYQDTFLTFFPSHQPDGALSEPLFRANCQQALEEGRFGFDWMFRTVQGDELPMHVKLVRVDLYGAVCLAVYMQDMRDMRHMEYALQQRNHELEHGNNLLHAVNTVAQKLLVDDSPAFAESAQFDQTVQHILGLLGRTAHVNRVYIWQYRQNENGMYCDQVYEWVQGVEALQGQPGAHGDNYDGMIDHWMPRFERGECIAACVHDLPGTERQYFAAQGIVSILVYPLLLHGNVWGFIGFDDCFCERQWTHAEKFTVKTCGVFVAASLERQRVSGALVQAKELAEQATMARGDFLARMSHEIRTPMNAILGLAYLCLQTELTSGQRQYVTNIQTSAQNLLGIINDILDFSKIEASKLDIVKEPFVMRHVVEGVIAMLETKAREKGLRLLSRVDGWVPVEVSGDALRVHQVLLNLCGNAVKFTDHGEVDVSVTMLRHDDEGWLLRCAVRDTGPGLSADEQRRLFQPYAQGDEGVAHRHGGTGLGLAISRQLVELMGGTLELESTKGKGCVFSFTLPCGLVNEVERAAGFVLGEVAMTCGRAADTARADSTFFEGLRVLLVEDNEINQLIAVSLLEQSGMLVTVAGNGLEACEKVASEPFDVVLMDIQMPELDGLEATQRIRARKETAQHPPIIAMTAHAMARDREEALAAGMNDYISKPFDPPKLMDILRTWVTR